MTKKNMIPALCYTTPANRDKSYLYCVGTLETIEKMMNEWNANGNPTPGRAQSTTLSTWRTLGTNKRAEAKGPRFFIA